MRKLILSLLIGAALALTACTMEGIDTEDQITEHANGYWTVHVTLYSPYQDICPYPAEYAQNYSTSDEAFAELERVHQQYRYGADVQFPNCPYTYLGSYTAYVTDPYGTIYETYGPGY